MIDHRAVSGLKLENNPVLLQELNGIPLSQKRHDIRRFFWIVTRVVVLISVIICYLNGIITCRYNYGVYPASCGLPYISAVALSGFVLTVIALSSVLIGLLFDFYFISLPGGRLMREKDSGHWDIMRTTTLSTRDIIDAKYTSAKFRAWRVLTIEVALRIATISVFEITNIIRQTGNPFVSDNIFLFRLLGTLVILGTFILEPIWRMQLVVSMGLASAVQGRDRTSVTMVNFGMLLAMRILQGILTAVYSPLVTILEARLRAIGISDDEWTLFGLACVMVFGILIYLFYRTCRHWMLRRALRFASLSNPDS